MFVSGFLFLLTYFFELLNAYGPKWSIWPDAVINGIEYIVNTLAGLNYFLPLDTFFECVLFFILFITNYYIVKLILSGINWVRGSGKIEI